MSVNVTKTITLNDLVNKAVDAGLVWRYSANEYNCQNYVQMLLSSSDLYSKKINTFVQCKVHLLARVLKGILLTPRHSAKTDERNLNVCVA